MATHEARAAQLREASAGISSLLNDDVSRAKAILSSDESPFHLFGLGLVDFLSYAIGMEDQALARALDCLSRSEHAATKMKTAAMAPPIDLNGKQRPRWWNPSLEADVIVADSVVAQAMCQLLTESIIEFGRAVIKLNRAHKIYTAASKAVLPEMKDGEGPDQLITRLNAMSLEAALRPNAHHSEPAPSRWGLGRLWGETAKPSRSSSMDPLPKLDKLHVKAPVAKRSSAGSSASVPGPVTAPATPDRTASPEPMFQSALGTPSLAPPSASASAAIPSWRGDDMAELVIGGSAFGAGLFELVFAMMPPKAKRAMSWFGYAAGSRKTGLKLLAVAAAGTDVHADFAALTLLSYLGLVIQLSSWQQDRAAILAQSISVLQRVRERLPKGTLWVYHEAKLGRMQGRAEESIPLLNSALSDNPNAFKQAQTLVRFEMSFTQICVGDWPGAVDSFRLLRKMNQWSHSTYAMLELGCLLMVEPRTDAIRSQLDALISTELPSTLGKKKLMGAQPSSEVFCQHHLDFYAAKRKRRHAKRAHEVYAIPPGLELAAFQWQTFGCASPKTCRAIADRLEALTPPVGTNLPRPPASTAHLDLDTVEELALRAALLGIMYRTLGDLATSRKHFDTAIALATRAPPSAPLDPAYTFLAPVARFERAALTLATADADRGTTAVKWAKALESAEADLAVLFATPAYDVQGRTESRAQMLRTEMASKRAQLGLPVPNTHA